MDRVYFNHQFTLAATYTYNYLNSGGRIIPCIKSAMKYRDGGIKGAGGCMPPQILVE
jgi:hypothetical protein